MHVRQTVSNEAAKWKALARYWCAFSLRGIAPALCDTALEFYKSVLQNYRKNSKLVADWEKISLKQEVLRYTDFVF